MVRDITSRPANYAEIEKLCQEQFTAKIQEMAQERAGGVSPPVRQSGFRVIARLVGQRSLWYNGVVGKVHAR